MVSTRRLLPSPGTPMSNAWPPERMVVKVCSTTVSWPKMTLLTSARALPMSMPRASSCSIMREVSPGDRPEGRPDGGPPGERFGGGAAIPADIGFDLSLETAGAEARQFRRGGC